MPLSRTVFFIFIVPCLALAACSSSAPIPRIAEPDLKPIADETTRKPVQFRRIVLKLNRGEQIGAIQTGFACLPISDLTWRGGRADFSGGDFDEIFADELKKANYKSVGDPDALFRNPDDWQAELLIGGTITELKANMCYPWATLSALTGITATSRAKGDAFVTVEWQIYSRLDRKTIYKTTTKGDGHVESARPGGDLDPVLFAFAKAARGLLADETFHHMATTSAPLLAGAEGTRGGPNQTALAPLSLTPSDGPGKRDLTQTSQSVVTVYAGDGWGSGFVIAKGGYVLTNSHVVEGAERVVIRRSDGIERVGKVLRTNRRRDVALIHVEDLRVPALSLRLETTAVGEQVFAVGSPLLDDLQGTVTSGIISGYRIFDGQPHIQADAIVNPGNSGGPLIDKNGQVIGLTVSGIFRQGGAITGLNFFIPIADALATLSLSVSPDTQS